jgi:hypothetical protein
MITELIGYVASAFVAISLVMVSFVKLRVLNLIGAVTFVVYGALIGSIPIIITNGFITAVNVFHLARIVRRSPGGFSYLAVGPEKLGQLKDFVSAYREDIRAFYPYFSDALLEQAFRGSGRVFLALRRLRVQGFAFYLPVPEVESVGDADVDRAIGYVRKNLYPERTLFMPVDYITRKYRDLGIAGKLYEELHREMPEEIKFLVFVVPADARQTRRFLFRNGYQNVEDFGRYQLFVRTLEE